MAPRLNFRTQGRPSTLGVLALILLCLACQPGGQEEAHPVVVVAELRRSLLASTTHTAGPVLEYPVAMARWKDSVVLADMMGAQLVVLSPSLEDGRAFGSRGAGPGELRRPQGLAVVGDTLVVFDRGNARLTWYHPSGRALRSRSLMIASLNPRFAALDGARLILPSGDPEHYAVLSSPGGRADADPGSHGHTTPWIARPPETPARGDPHITSNMVVSTPVGIFFVDAENGLVARTQARIDPLPPWLRRHADQAIAALARDDRTGQRVLNPITAAGASPDGLAIRIIGDGHPWGAILNAAGEWTELWLAPHLREGFPTAVADLFIYDDELFVLTRDGLRVYGLAARDDLALANN